MTAIKPFSFSTLKLLNQNEAAYLAARAGLAKPQTDAMRLGNIINQEILFGDAATYYKPEFDGEGLPRTVEELKEALFTHTSKKHTKQKKEELEALCELLGIKTYAAGLAEWELDERMHYTAEEFALAKGIAAKAPLAESKTALREHAFDVLIDGIPYRGRFDYACDQVGLIDIKTYAAGSNTKNPIKTFTSKAAVEGWLMQLAGYDEWLKVNHPSWPAALSIYGIEIGKNWSYQQLHRYKRGSEPVQEGYMALVELLHKAMKLEPLANELRASQPDCVHFAAPPHEVEDYEMPIYFYERTNNVI